MLRRTVVMAIMVLATTVASTETTPREVKAAGRGQPSDWNRFYHYPYVYYPHNFQRQQGSFDHLYYRYPPNRRIPVYNTNWHNYYPSLRPYHKGHHFILDVL